MNDDCYCGECGEKLKRIHGTAYLRCCNGWGYWSREKPWANWPNRRWRDWYLYWNKAKWPDGKPCVYPKF